MIMTACAARLRSAGASLGGRLGASGGSVVAQLDGQV